MAPSVGEILFRGGLSQLNGRAASSRDSAAAAVPAPESPAPASRLSTNAPAHGAPRAGADWLDWMRSGLPAELAPHVVRVLLKAGGGSRRELVVFADSPAWCARLRYALLALAERIRARDPAIAHLSARVMRLD